MNWYIQYKNFVHKKYHSFGKFEEDIVSEESDLFLICHRIAGSTQRIT